jgi:hypothetical protein
MCLCGNWQFPIEQYEVNLHGVQGHRAVNLTISERLDDCDNEVGPRIGQTPSTPDPLLLDGEPRVLQPVVHMV